MKLINSMLTKIQTTVQKSNSDKIKWVNISTLKIDTEIESIFIQKEADIKNISDDMLVNGFDPVHPIVLCFSKTEPELNGIIADGHTRYKAAKKSGIEKVAIVYKDFQSKEELIKWVYQNQLSRRNLSDSELFNAYIALRNIVNKNGKKEKSDEEIAKELDISRRQVSKMKEVEKKASPETFNAFKDGKISLYHAYSQMKKDENQKEQTKSKDIAEGKPKSSKLFKEGYQKAIKQAIESITTCKTVEDVVLVLNKMVSHE